MSTLQDGYNTPVELKYEDESSGSTLIYCHAGCDAKDILDRVGLILYTIKVGDLYQRFYTWCSKCGGKAVTSIRFGKKLREKGVEQCRSNGWPHWKGIGALKFN